MKQMDKNMLDSHHVGRLLFVFTIPAFISMAVQTLYNLVDTAFIGRYVGSEAIGGLTLVFPIQMLSMSIAITVGIGGASLISRLLGANQAPRLSKLYKLLRKYVVSPNNVDISLCCLLI